MGRYRDAVFVLEQEISFMQSGSEYPEVLAAHRGLLAAAACACNKEDSSQILSVMTARYLL